MSATLHIPAEVPRQQDTARTPGALKLPGELSPRRALPRPAGYAVFDCETTGVKPAEDEIVSFALVLLDPDGAETGRLSSLVRPSRPIPSEATAVHGLREEDVAAAPLFEQLASRLLEQLDGRVFVAHNASFDLEMLDHAFRSVGRGYQPAAVACTLEAFRLLEPLAADHRLASLCHRHGVALADAHHATSDVLATSALVRVLLAMDVAPESARLDHSAFMRLRSAGDTRSASDPQIRRVFALARVAGLIGRDGHVDPDTVSRLLQRVAGVDDPGRLTREQVQIVYDELEALIEAQTEATVAGRARSRAVPAGRGDRAARPVAGPAEAASGEPAGGGRTLGARLKGACRRPFPLGARIARRFGRAVASGRSRAASLDG
jgi:DNA polymerase-3 subunit epsilon